VGAERWDEQVGSVADEAGRLLESLRRTAAESAARESVGHDGADAEGRAPAAGSRSASGSAGAAAAAAGGPDGSRHDPSCTWCPLCRGAAVVRSLSPETLAKLADLATLAATVLTDLASSRPAGGPPASGPDEPAAEPARGSARPGHRSRHPGPAQSRPIPVIDADDPQEAPRG
jgi:hypothetical protein